jgi:hypothetical protein
MRRVMTSVMRLIIVHYIYTCIPIILLSIDDGGVRVIRYRFFNFFFFLLRLISYRHNNVGASFFAIATPRVNGAPIIRLTRFRR